MKPRHIGIVACSAEGAALCYKTICESGEEFFGKYEHPEVSLHGASFADYMERIDRDDWRGVAEIMLASANKLASAGAEILITPDNTIHRAMPYVASRSPLPWLHIAEVVADEAEQRGFTRLGITGTRFLVESDVYPTALAKRDIKFVRPNAAERQEIHRIIFDELVHGIFKTGAVAYFQQTIARLKGEGCDAVVLGCTEIPLIVNDDVSPLPTLDSTRLLALAALRESMRGAVTAP